MQKKSRHGAVIVQHADCALAAKAQRAKDEIEQDPPLSQKQWVRRTEGSLEVQYRRREGWQPEDDRIPRHQLSRHLSHVR